MSNNRVALVSDDQHLAGCIQTHLKKNLGQPVFQCNFASVRSHLSQETDGLLLLAATSDAQAEAILRLVREIYIRKLPPVIMIVGGEEAGRMDELEQYVAQYLHWPLDAGRLTQLIRERMGRTRDFLATNPNETIEQVISRQLLTQTPSLLPLVERMASGGSP